MKAQKRNSHVLLVATIATLATGKCIASDPYQELRAGLAVFKQYRVEPQFSANLAPTLEKTLRERWSPKPGEADCSNAWGTVEKLLGTVDEMESSRREVQGAASAGYSADSAGTEHRSTTSIDASIGLGSYPTQLRLDAGASLTYLRNDQNQSLTEDVTKIRLNFDHYYKPWLEAFVFTERFADSYMHIDQRYEVGIGAKFERNILLTEKGGKSAREFVQRSWQAHNQLEAEKPKELEKSACLIKVDIQNAEVAPLTLPAELSGMLNPLSGKETAALSVCTKSKDPLKNTFNAESCNNFAERHVRKVDSANTLAQFLRHQYAKIELGFSVAVLADFEQADTFKFQTQAIPSDPSVPTPKAIDQAYKPPGEQRFRLSLRPSFRWRIDDNLSFSARVFYKPALDSPRKVDGDRDYRIDAVGEMRWRLSPIVISGKESKVALKLNYDWHYDSVPPTATTQVGVLNAAHLLSLSAAPIPPPSSLTFIGHTTAEKRHAITRLGIEFEF